MKWNTSNMWRMSFAVLLIGIFLGVAEWKAVSEIFITIGGIMLICMGCWRFEDVKDFLDRNGR